MGFWFYPNIISRTIGIAHGNAYYAGRYLHSRLMFPKYKNVCSNLLVIRRFTWRITKQAVKREVSKTKILLSKQKIAQYFYRASASELLEIGTVPPILDWYPAFEPTERWTYGG